MKESESNLNAWISMLLVAATASLWIFSTQGTLSTARPQQVDVGAPGYIIGEQNVTARLWEDPLQAVWQQGKEETVAPPQMPQDLGAQISTRASHGEDLLFLGVFIEGTPYPEDHETRLRIRHAVQAGLLACHFRPEDRSHLGCLALPWPKVAVCPNTGNEHRLLVPYEWFCQNAEKARAAPADSEKACTQTKPRRILVLWLQEEEFADAPLERLALLLEGFDNDGMKRLLYVIGPRSSNTVAAIAGKKVLEDRSLAHARRVFFFSPEATAPDARIGFETKKTDAKLVPAPRQAVASELTMRLGLPEGAKEVHFTNCTALDDSLMDLIVAELELRGLTFLRTPAQPTRCADAIAVISEADTFYGLTMPATLREAIHSYRTTYDPADDVADDNVLVFHYLRGLDGKTSREEKKSSRSSGQTPSPEQALQAALQRASELPEGEAQFDYVRRIAFAMDREDARRRAAGRPGIRAIGVLGSDCYDKLILLQALRKCFPHAVYFTTDLDVRLWDEEQLPHTRNLLVASAYVIEPGRETGAYEEKVAAAQRSPERETPWAQFRDSYQSAVFHAVCTALHKPEAPARFALTHAPAPRLYEIGSRGPVQLSLDPGRLPAKPWDEQPEALASEEQPARDRGSDAWGLALVVTAAVAVFLFFRGYRSGRPDEEAESGRSIARWSKRWKDALLIAAILIAAALLCAADRLFRWVGERAGEEPFLWRDGISVWPTELLRVATLLFIIWFLAHVWQRLVSLREDLESVYSLSPPAEDADSSSLPSNGNAAAPPAQDSPPRQAFGRSVLKYLKLFFLYSWTLEKADKKDARGLFEAYRQQGALHCRIIRTARLTVPYGVCGFLLMKWLGSPERPVRGDLTSVIDSTLLFATILALVAGIFFIVDHALLARRLFIGLADPQSKWPRNVRECAAAKRGLNPCYDEIIDKLDGVIDMEFVTDHTRRTRGFIYFPFMALLLMALSRSSVFDRWPWPPALLIIFLVNAALAVAALLYLRSAAQRVKSSALAQADSEKMAASFQRPTGFNLVHPFSTAQLDVLRDEIQANWKSAYGRLLQDPTWVALLLPTGGFGIIVIVLKCLYAVS